MTDCNPGVPTPEACNLLDDDCDGLVDDGNLCAGGQTCQSGTCVAAGSAGQGGGPPGTGGSGAGADTGSGAGAGGSGVGHPTGTGGATGGSDPGANSPGPGPSQTSASGCSVAPGSRPPAPASPLVVLLLCLGVHAGSPASRIRVASRRRSLARDGTGGSGRQPSGAGRTPAPACASRGYTRRD
jgi:hypothetical protein